MLVQHLQAPKKSSTSNDWKTWGLSLTLTWTSVLVLAVSAAQAADSRGRLAVVTTKDPFRHFLLEGGNLSGDALKLAPDDLNARGQELDNTFYEIDAPAPYGPPTLAPLEATTTAMNDLGSASVEAKSGMSWSVLAAGAAGIVGLSTLGFLVLSEDETKAAQKNIRVITDK